MIRGGGGTGAIKRCGGALRWGVGGMIREEIRALLLSEVVALLLRRLFVVAVTAVWTKLKLEMPRCVVVVGVRVSLEGGMSC